MPSSISDSLSPGAQLLTNGALLPPRSGQTEIGGNTSEEGVKSTTATTLLHSGNVISGSITSPDGDTVELSAEALQMLQQMGEFDSGTATQIPAAAHSFSAAASYESFDYFG